MRSGRVRYCSFVPTGGERMRHLEELWALKNEDPGFSFVPTITGPGYRGLGGVARPAASLWA